MRLAALPAAGANSVRLRSRARYLSASLARPLCGMPMARTVETPVHMSQRQSGSSNPTLQPRGYSADTPTTRLRSVSVFLLDSPEAYAFARVLRECLPALLSAPGVCWLPAAAAGGAPAAATTAAAAAADVMEDESGMESDGVFSDFAEEDDSLGDCYGMAFAPLT